MNKTKALLIEPQPSSKPRVTNSKVVIISKLNNYFDQKGCKCLKLIITDTSNCSKNTVLNNFLCETLQLNISLLLIDDSIDGILTVGQLRMLQHKTDLVVKAADITFEWLI